MEENHQGIKRQDDDDIEEIPHDFQCSVCLDLIHKPVVLACGHIACFWCVFKAMDSSQESRCMVCRHCYNHFPRVCKLMHYLLLKLYPLTYKLRERHVSEEEEKLGYVSPQFENYSTESQKFEEIASESTVKSHPMVKAPNSVTSGDGELSSASVSPIIKLATPSNGAIQETVAKKGGEVACKPVLATDVSCSLCKQLLCQPVVLNCGDVFCEPCIKNPGTVPKCPTCDSAHPSGFPNVCLVLEHFIEELFPVEYKARKHSLPQRVDSPQVKESTCSQDQKEAAPGSSVPTNYYSSWLSGQGQTVHLRAGCDYCGMCPIIGERYRCKDCKEKIGFDLCEQCHRGSAKLPGRFNQQHKEDHEFEIVEALTFSEIIQRHEAESFDDDSSIDEDEEEAAIADILSIEAVPEFVSDHDRSPSSNATSEHHQERSV